MLRSLLRREATKPCLEVLLRAKCKWWALYRIRTYDFHRVKMALYRWLSAQPLRFNKMQAVLSTPWGHLGPISSRRCAALVFSAHQLPGRIGPL